MVMERLRPAVLLLLSLAVIFCQGQDDPCNDAALVNCDQCINRSPECVWCPLTSVTARLKADFPGVQNFRCRSRDSFLHQNTSCGGPDGETKVLQDPRSSSNITVDEDLTEEAVVGVPTIQVSPQNIVLKLRRGESVSFNMTFRSLRNTPLDVYFLFDFSASLSPIITTLRDNVIAIANSLETISAAYALGLGTFVDKPTLPFATTSNTVSEDGSNLTTCRAGIPDPCVPAYGYRHFLSLVQDVDAFTDAINASSISGNLDSIEGGLDAVLQAAVCRDIIGWRSDALRMLFYVSDQGYHLAGDGRLSGSYRPNDGQCHLEQQTLESGTLVYEYTSSVQQDYPSIRQLRDAMIETNIVPIFVIRSSNRSAASILAPYNALASTLVDVSADVRQLDRQRDTDITLLEGVIRESYERTSQRISPNDPGIDGYSFNFDPIDGCPTVENGVCIVEFGDNIVFNVTVTLDSCDDRSIRDIKLVGPPFSFSAVQLVPQCSCECSDEPESGTDICSGFGQRVCGVCICNTNNGNPVRFGDQCQCEEEVQTCPQGDGMDCSGQGSCDACGICNCDPGFFGTACECELEQCPRGDINGTSLICSGRGNCTCVNGQSVCECETALVSRETYDYFQPTIPLDGNCECDPNNCHNNQSMALCATLNADGIQYRNNPDSCRCAGCQCAPGLLNIDNICLSVVQACMNQEVCARCSVQETSSGNCTGCDPAAFRTFGIEETLPDDFRVMCDFQYSGCTYTFYLSETKTSEVLISDDINCPLGALPWIIAGSLVGAILLLGLLALILLKLLFMFLDRIEYGKFTKELQQADFAPHENPLYLNPQQDYQNPLRRPTKRITE